MKNNWDIMAPYARLGFSIQREVLQAAAEKGVNPLEQFHQGMELIPGVKFRRGLWEVPVNALEVVEDLRQQHWGVSVEVALWGREPKEQLSWGEVEAALIQTGHVRPWVLDGFLTQYQKDALCFGWNLDGVHYWHSTGSGKTLTGLLCSLSAEGATVVVTRAASRLQYGREAERFLSVKAHVLRPASVAPPVRVNGESRWEWMARNRHLSKDVNTGMSYSEWSAEHRGEFDREQKKTEWAAYKAAHTKKGINLKDGWNEHKAKHGVDQLQTLSEYMTECRLLGRKPVVIVGWEALPEYANDLCAIRPGAVIYDELHKGKNPKRWDVLHLSDLPEDPEEARDTLVQQERDAKKQGGFIKDTDDGRKMFIPVESIAALGARLGRASRKRIGTTATPIKNRVSDLWSQLDMVEPNAWGNTTLWMNRHADRKPGTYGGYDTSGSSNLDELNRRLQKVAHILKYEQTHGDLPPKRRQSVYVSPEDQCQPSAGFGKELREAKKRGATSVLEVKLAMAASRKRKAVIGMVEDHLSSRQKIVIFTGRRRDCESLGRDVRKLGVVKSGTATAWVAHGEHSTSSRQAIIDEYMAHPGPCVLVGTGHAFGESLNIHDTDAAFMVMLPYTPGELRQWEGRFARRGQKRSVVIYYVIAEDTVDEHVASILIDKLPAVEDIAQDAELAAAKDALSGIDPNETEDEFMAAVLADLDFD